MNSATLAFAGLLIIPLLAVILLIIGYYESSFPKFVSVSLRQDEIHVLQPMAQPSMGASSSDVQVSIRSLSYPRQILRASAGSNSDDILFLNTSSIRMPMLLPLPKRILVDDQSSETMLAQALILADNIAIEVRFSSDISSSYNETSVMSMLDRFCDQMRAKEVAVVDSSEIKLIDKLVIHIDWKLLEDYRTHQNIANIHESIADLQTKQRLNEYQEEYILSLPGSTSTAIEIYANEIGGLRAGLASLAQILAINPSIAISLPMTIHDWSMNAWRGLLIDVSRHYQPIQLLKRCIDAMELSKLNKLHLHLTDAQSFPILLDDTADWPLSALALHGPFSQDKIYTKTDLKALIAYGSERGIEVIPEIDVPAHSLSWGKSLLLGNVSLIASCDRVARSKETPTNIYTLDPTIPEVRSIVKAVLTQVVEIFPTAYMHIGGDEVDLSCWTSIPRIQDYLTEHKLTASELLADFEAEMITHVRSLNKIPMVWQGLLDAKVLSESDDKPMIIQPWKCWSNLAVRAAELAATKFHHPIVMSACWYLDYDSEWLDYLAVDLIAASSSAIQKHDQQSQQPIFRGNQTKERLIQDQQMIYGGEGSMWTEHVDATNLECRMWPRAIAIAMRLWGYRIHDPKLTSLHRSPTTQIHARHLSGRRRLLSEDLLSVTAAQHLYQAMLRYRFFLHRDLHIQAADMVFHLSSTSSASSSSKSLKPQIITNLSMGMHLIETSLSQSISLTRPNSIVGSSKLVAMTSQCPGIPEFIQRPWQIDRLKLAFYNIENGVSSADRRREELLTRWLQDKAATGYLAIGFCELNGWDGYESSTNSKLNHPKLVTLAAKAGFVHSHVMSLSQPYPIGIISSLAFTVIAEYGPPRFQRGVLHVYYERFDLHVLVVHLHAHDSQSRLLEAQQLVQITSSLNTSSSTEVMIMGDFNTLSAYDQAGHGALLQLIDRYASSQSTIQRFAKKFLAPSSLQSINYQPMEALLANGFHDLCIRQRSSCPYSQPTLHNPEWSAMKAIGVEHPKLRLDYILTRGSDAQVMIDISNLTDLISDHYPVLLASAKIDPPIQLYRHRHRH
jgi:endonuclease/exonuclease/phosphatase family metal-dependent hydrolase